MDGHKIYIGTFFRNNQTQGSQGVAVAAWKKPIQTLDKSKVGDFYLKISDDL